MFMMRSAITAIALTLALAACAASPAVEEQHHQIPISPFNAGGIPAMADQGIRIIADALKE